MDMFFIGSLVIFGIVALASTWLLKQKWGIKPHTHMYVVRENEQGNVTATTTLTIHRGIVVTQSPNGRDKHWAVPSMIGHTAKEVRNWCNVDRSHRRCFTHTI